MKSSSIADEIIREWNREKYFKRLAENKKKLQFKCKLDEKMQCDTCKYKDNCIDREDV